MADPLVIFRALADATRLRILALLRRMELSVGELAQVLGQSQPRVSRHVKILCDAGLAERRKEGAWVFVTRGAPALVGPVDAAIAAWRPDASATEASDAELLAAVRRDRAAAAAAWFESHAHEWDAIRSLHVAESAVEAAMQRLIGSAPIGNLVDIGTGTGRMLELFAGQADSAIGIDRSPEMLRVARAKLSSGAIANAELRQADLFALPLAAASADLAIVHHVLHFVETPEAAIAEAARVLGPAGRLLIVDFAAHDREELRTRDAHARLGFADDQIAGWVAASGLAMQAVETLAGGPLTVKLWLARRPGARLEEVKAA